MVERSGETGVDGAGELVGEMTLEVPSLVKGAALDQRGVAEYLARPL